MKSLLIATCLLSDVLAFGGFSARGKGGDDECLGLLAEWQCKVPALQKVCKAYAGVSAVHGERFARVVAGGGDGVVDARNDADMMYEIASLTKVFTALLLQMLADLGRLSLGDTIGSILSLPPKDMRDPRVLGITLRQLASHTSGLSVMPTNLHGSANNKFAYYTRQDVLEELMPQPLATEPGKYEYSNWAFGLLGFLLEEVMGEPIEDLLSEHILRPLGLTRTTAGQLAELQWRTAVLDGHASDGKVANRKTPYGAIKAQGSVHSTLRDMLRFLCAFLISTSSTKPAAQCAHVEVNDAIQSAMRAMIATPVADTPIGQVYLGLEKLKDASGTWFIKTGDSEGYSDYMGFDTVAFDAVVTFDTCAGCQSGAWDPAMDTEWKPMQKIGQKIADCIAELGSGRVSGR